jgi:dTMP kinase
MFISMCGVEGAGKTTQIQNLASYLKQKGKEVVVTREPGGTQIGKRIRRILLDPKSRNLDPKAELFLYAADRVQHIQELILPSLKQNKIVITDRFVDSTTVYQGFGRGLNMDLVEKINTMVLNGLKPDITFLLDLDPKEGLRRTQKQLHKGERMNTESRFEMENLRFHEKIRQGFLILAKKEPDRFFIVDASKPEAKVRDQILGKIGEIQIEWVVK